VKDQLTVVTVDSDIVGVMKNAAHLHTCRVCSYAILTRVAECIDADGGIF
jgi:hypothetical protein